MSDSNKKPGPPPDDFSKTVPNIRRDDDAEQSDWNKTNYNYPKQPAADDWGKTVTNIRPIDTDNDDFGKTMYPGAKNAPEADWGATRPNIRTPDTDFGGPEPAHDKTTPYFQLPEAEREKYQNLPPTPTEAAAQAALEEKGGIPGWVWIAAGLFSMFMFAVLVLLVVYLFFLPDSGYEATLRRAPAGSEVFVDNEPWGVSNPDGSKKFSPLKPGRHVITIKHPTYECEPQTVEGGWGTNPEPIVARCRQLEVKQGERCDDIKLGEEDKAERCYNAALDALPDPFTVEDLVNALNILIINFDSGRFDIPAKRLEALRKGAGFIQKLPPSVVLEIGGHTDNDGTDATNQPLSNNRANAVKQVLVGYGVRGEMLQTKGYGASQPKTTNDTELGKFYNRRIQYSVVRK